MHSLDLVVSFLWTFDFPGHRPCCWKTTTYKHWDSDRHRHTQTGTQRHWDTETQRQGETKTRWHIGIITYRRRQTHGGTSTETHIVIHTQTHRHRNTINPCMLSTHNRAPIHSLSSRETTHTPLLCYCHRLWSYRQPVSATKLSAVTSTWSSLYRPLYGSISLLPLLSYDPYRCYGFSCLNSQVFSEFFFVYNFRWTQIENVPAVLKIKLEREKHVQCSRRHANWGNASVHVCEKNHFSILPPIQCIHFDRARNFV